LGGAVFLSGYDEVLIQESKFNINSAHGSTADDIYATGTSNLLQIKDTTFVNP
jgi:hypothetical protein